MMAMPSFYLFMELFSYIIKTLEGFVMKFSEYKYERPNLEELQSQYASFIEQLKNAKNADEFMTIFIKISHRQISEMLCYFNSFKWLYIFNSIFSCNNAFVII